MNLILLRINIDQIQDVGLLTNVILALNRTIQHWKKPRRLYENGRKRYRNGRYSLKIRLKFIFFRVLQLAHNLLLAELVHANESNLFLNVLQENLIYQLDLHFSRLIINLFIQ